MLSVSSESASLAKPLAGFQSPPRQTQRADFPHWAFLFASPQGLCDLSCRSNFRKKMLIPTAAEQPQGALHPFPTPPLPAETLKFPGRKPQNISAFALTYILLRRSCKRMGAFIIHPCLPVSQRKCKQQGPFTPRTLLRFFATMGPSATLSSSTDFLGSPVIRFAAPPISRRDEEGFSSCLAHPCHRAAANTPPECLAASVSCGNPCCLRPFGAGSAPGAFRVFEATYAFTFVAAR